MAIIDTTGGGANSGSNTLGITGYPFTVAAWVRRSGDHTTNGHVAGLGGAWENHHSLWVSSVEQPIQVSRYNNGTADNNILATTVTSGAWRPVVARWTASNDRSVFLSTLASKEDDTTDVGGYSAGGGGISTFDVGRFSANSGYPFLGLITHVAVWNKALSDGEVETFLNGGNPLAIDDTTLVGYWVDTFEDVSGTWYWRDESGNTNDLTLEAGASLDEVTAGPTVDAPPSSASPGITITGIKEPNESDTLVTGVTNAVVKAWYGSPPSDTGAEDELLTAQSISEGSMTPELGLASVGNDVILVVKWDAGSGETKFFRTTGTIIDLDA